MKYPFKIDEEELGCLDLMKRRLGFDEEEPGHRSGSDEEEMS